MAVYTVNLEQGMPTAAEARIKLDQAIRSAKQKGHKAIKIIHGYGSSGKGGAIKRDAHEYLTSRKRAGGIRAFVGGENFSPFDADARVIISAEPSLSRDRDYSRCNQGITVILI